MYFALEYLEQLFLQTFTTNLCTQLQITSLIYVHDGFYCAPAPSQEQLRRVALLTTQQLQLPYLPIKMIDLVPEWQQHYGHLRNTLNTSNKTIAQPISHHCKHVTTTVGGKRKSHVLSDQQHQSSIANYFQKNSNSQSPPSLSSTPVRSASALSVLFSGFLFVMSFRPTWR